MNGDCCKVGRNVTGLERISSRSMGSVFQRSVVVGLLVVGSAAGTAHAQEQAAQQVSIEDALRAAAPAAEGLAAARAKFAGAEDEVVAAKSGYFPQLNASASYSLTLASEFDGIDFGGGGGGDVELPFGQRNTWRLGASVSQQVYDGGRTRANVRAARVGVALANLSVQQIRASAVFIVTQAYYAAALTQRQVEIAEASLASAEATFADAQLKNVNGAIAEFDVVRSEVARDNERNALVQAQAARDSAFLRVKRLLGIPLDRPIELTSSLDLADAADVDSVIAQARTAAGLAVQPRHLGIAQAELGVRGNQGRLDAAKADRLPQVTAVSDFGLVDYAAHPFNTDWKRNWTFGVNVTFPVFDGFRRSAMVRKARADVAVARAQLDDATRHAALDAAQADTQIAAAQATWQSSGRTVTQAKRAYQIAELRFSQGASSQIELVDARLLLNQAELNQARSAHDLRIARLRRELLDGLPFAGF